MGAIFPTGNTLATSMARLIEPDGGASVLELGPGTGAITKAILSTGLAPQKLICVEYSKHFIPQLRQAFPQITVLHGNAFDLDTVLPVPQTPPFGAIVSALPLLNFANKDRSALLESLFDRLLPNAPVIQFSYSAFSPLPKDPKRYSTESVDWVLRNIPPARVWVYRRKI